MRRNYDVDDKAFGADAYTFEEYAGIGWRVLGWETEPDEDTEWTGIEERTGQIVAVMIGDDRHFTFDPEDAKPLAREAYCGECGQLGCCHDGLDRAE